MREPLLKSDMDIVRRLFAIRFVPGGAPSGCFELYIEDDGLYHHQCTVNNFWLKDLIAVATAADQSNKKKL